MGLTLEVTSHVQRDRLGDDAVRQFGREGGTIGRAGDNDWRLPDSERYISSHHATIDFQAGSYYLIDTSTNGVYVNGSDVPVGRSKPQRLFDGDVLRLGEYVISVTIDEGFELETEEPDHRSTLAREDLVQIDEDTGQPSMLDAEQITGAQALRSRLYGEDSTDTFVQRQYDATDRKPKIKEKVTPMIASVDTGKSPAEASAPARAEASQRTEALPEDAVAAFLQGLGVAAEEIGQVDERRLLHNAGVALREFVLGARELLQNRAAVKNSFRLEQTTIQPQSNNPLKFSAGVDDAMRIMLNGRQGEHGRASEIVREAVSDLKHHEIAIICAMRDAVCDFADYFEPDDLEQKFDESAKRGSRFGGGARAKYWELYRELYDVITRHDKDKLPQQYGEDFARAYVDHLERLRRDNRKRKDTDRPLQAGA